MITQSSLKAVNPNLKTSFSTFTSAIIASVVLLTIFEQLGVNSIWLGYLMISVPVIAYIIIGVISRTVLLSEFFVSGRRVPAFYNGMALAISAIGGVGFFALTGIFVSLGYDALPFVFGLIGGFVLMAILFAPYMRKFGAYTLPSFLSERYQSSALRLLAAILLIPPALLLLTAEFRIGAEILSQFTSASYNTLVFTCGAVMLLSILPGGMRGLTWTQCAQYIVVLLGFLAPIVILSIQYTSLPIPQLTYGSLLNSISEMEAMNGAINETRDENLSTMLANSSLSLEKSFAQIFGKLSTFEYITLSLAIMLGIASMPSLMSRSNLSLNVADMRVSMSWGTLLLGILLISIPAFAVFVKFLMLKNIVGQQFVHLPDWFNNLKLAGLVQIEDLNRDGIVSLREISLARDGVPLILPIIGELHFVLVGFIAAAGVSAALAAAAAHALIISHSLSNDILHSFILPNASKTKQLILSRLTLIFTLVCAAMLALQQEFDIFQLTITGLNIAASTFFAPVLLSIWYKKSSAIGIISSMITGFSLSLLFLYLTEYIGLGTILGISSLTHALISVPIAVIMGILVSRFYAEASADIINIGDDIRVPRGETLYDRAIRLASRKK